MINNPEKFLYYFRDPILLKQIDKKQLFEGVYKNITKFVMSGVLQTKEKNFAYKREIFIRKCLKSKHPSIPILF